MPTKLLNELISQAETQAENVDTNNVDAINRAARKWRRMQEELEDEMLKAHNSGTTFQRKRRIDVTLAMGELVQRQRRRFNPTESAYNDTNGNGSSTSTAAYNLDSAMATFLTKCCLGNPIDKESLENISKYAYSGSTDSEFPCDGSNLTVISTYLLPIVVFFRNWRFIDQAPLSHYILTSKHV